MNLRSIKCRLVAWYAGFLVASFLLLSAAAYLALETSLTSALRENQLRRARQIGQLLREQLQRGAESNLGKEVEARYAPARNNRFVRISRRDGLLLYRSTAPKDQEFDPELLPTPDWVALPEAARQVPLTAGRKLLLVSHTVQASSGAAYLVETGAPLDEVQAELHKWLIFLGLGLPVVGAIALGGGYILVKRALYPVDQISASAERISSHSLSERLPVAQTGDELERLSQALNHMIERLDAALQHSRRFVADASHELRTPLTVLRGELDALCQASSLTREWQERLESAREEAERLAKIVEGLFAISRLDAGEAAAEWLKFDLGELAAATVEQLALLAEDKKLQTTCTLGKGVWIEGDRARIKQVLVNLLDNALKYTPAGGAVGVAVKTEDGKAVLEIEDNGIGIPAEALPRIFERFYRVDSACTREAGGAGLGLSIVKSICSAHHGRVAVSSTPGRGSRFRVELPLVAAPSGLPRESPAPLPT